ncbi:hypothetical protein [Cellulophaga baltica]|uniref:hypothetical protein n=1 Tax=Cellulophaga baltica TaxID=76594 RepID=UPI0015F62804|nr:hypothetical protein [Cellulophaga baltica]MBA6316949.1 ankyrin repeat domain-containing protein [Cellulophaga baltica]
MIESRSYKIEDFAGKGELERLKKLLGNDYTQLEIDIALGNALAYSRIETADYLLSLGADFSNYNYDGVYYAAHNNELDGLKYAVAKGVDINVREVMILNTSIMTFINEKDIKLIRWLLENGADINHLTQSSKELIERYGTDELKSIIEESNNK